MKQQHPWLGRQHSEETKKKMSEAREKFWTTEKRNKASESRNAWMKDPVKSKRWRESVKNIDRSYMKTDAYRKRVSLSKQGTFIGSKNPRWNGHNIKLLVSKALERDGCICRSCGLHDEEIMQVDHIIPRRIAPEKYLDLGNLQSLCPNCHMRKTLNDLKLYGKTKR